ncbi:MAG: hypothetical protein CK528_16130 [Alcaligenaceae bacterium]|nr:MAG: hypothetical protein CK528_16130 [Alcaligenaceae bacterium]
MARLLSAPMSAKLGVAVVVENKGGASGNIGTVQAARAKPDGYPSLLAASGKMLVAASLAPLASAAELIGRDEFF